MINSAYDNPQTIEKIQKKLAAESIVHLQEFFDSETYNAIAKDIKKPKYKKSIMPLEHQYTEARVTPAIRERLSNKKFLKTISQFFGKDSSIAEIKIISLTWKEYSVLHDGSVSNACEFIADFTEDWNDTFGGNILYGDGEGNYQKIPARRNSIILMKNGTLKRFFQYCNHYAKNKRRYLIIGAIEGRKK